MKNLLAIFLATALLVGCATKNHMSDDDWESLIGWCNQNKAQETIKCDYFADLAQYSVNENGYEKDCTIIAVKRIVASANAKAASIDACAP
jgi:hypothetical protein